LLCEKAGIPTTATEPATDRLASARADPGGRVLQREDICTVWRDGAGPGARSKEQGVGH
jgi:hypothetical protein